MHKTVRALALGVFVYAVLQAIVELVGWTGLLVVVLSGLMIAALAVLVIALMRGEL